MPAETECAAWRLWDGNQLVGLLDAHEGVRRAFVGFLNVGDVLADLSVLSTNLNQHELGPTAPSPFGAAGHSYAQMRDEQFGIGESKRPVGPRR